MIKNYSINPNSTYDYLFNQVDLTVGNVYPRFIHQLKFNQFRHIDKLEVNFPSPVTVISGSNKSGKTTILLTIACSHFGFKKRNYSNGRLERQTWSHVLKATHHDVQNSDWTYFLNIKTGNKTEDKRGQRKKLTKKWNGLGKKESQIKDVRVVYLDLDRILPARYFSSVILKKAQRANSVDLSQKNHAYIVECMSYIFEQNYEVTKLADHLGKDLLGYSEISKYSSYNSASGEDVISRILIDSIEAPDHSLVLIDEIELGLHPQVQRRLMDIIFDISKKGHKQFIVTTHSSTIISCVPDKARVFVDTTTIPNRAVNPISINAVLSKMDSSAYPLVDVFCEDDLAKKIIFKALQEIDNQRNPRVTSKLFNIIISGSADKTYRNFEVRRDIYDAVPIKSGHVCILDGDMRNNRAYSHQEGVYFLPGKGAPEKLLSDIYEKNHNNSKIRYHIEHSNPHCLFEKLQNFAPFSSREEAFDACWECLINDSGMRMEFDALVEFLKNECLRYSPTS